MSRSHVSNTTLTLGSTGTPATPQGKKMVWNRRKQEWMEVEASEEPTVVSPATGPQLSSNAYASGVHQNSGNFLTEKPITRVHAPPGGVSSISFGDYEEKTPSKVATTGAQPQLSSSTPTQPTTPESLEETATEGPIPPIPMKELPPTPSADAGQTQGEDEDEIDEATAEVAPGDAADPPAPPATEVVSANAYASGTNQNSGNFMTGRPTTRVRAPPGGASSITFG